MKWLVCKTCRYLETLPEEKGYPQLYSCSKGHFKMAESYSIPACWKNTWKNFDFPEGSCPDFESARKTNEDKPQAKKRGKGKQEYAPLDELLTPDVMALVWEQIRGPRKTFVRCKELIEKRKQVLRLFEEKKSIRQISKETGASAQLVRKLRDELQSEKAERE